VEYDIFLNGHRKRPPDDLRMRVEKLAKQLAESSGMSVQERFRYNTLVGRFYVYRDLWRCSQMEREMGRAGAPQDAGPKPAAALESFSISIADAGAEEGEVRRLHEMLLRLSGSSTEAKPPMSFSNFARYIERQCLAIRLKHGCESVRFTLSARDDAIRFTASPEPSRKP